MAWQEISIGVPHEYVEPVSYLFSRYGKGLAMESDGPDRILLKTYLPTTSRSRLARIDVGVKLVSAIEPLGQLRVQEVKEEAWQEAWKSHFDLLKIGRRLVIKPTWIDYQAATNEILIEIDPGMAFGTGYHPTTYTCLEAMEHTVKAGSSVLDLGTGSGILSIAAIRLGAGSVTAMDIDAQAVRAARQNLRRTRVLQQTKLVQGTLPHAQAGPGRFDLVVANISARAICERASFIVSTLKEGGSFIASGMLKDQAQEVLNVMSSLGCCLEREWPREEWVTLVFQPAARSDAAVRCSNPGLDKS